MSESSDHLVTVRQQFTRQADAYVRTRQATDEKGLRALVALSGAAPAHRALDVACGPGFLTMALARRCAAAVGLDATDVFLEGAREEAKRCGLANLEFRSGDAERLPFEDGAFDIVTCRAAFHHFARPAHVLGEMARVVKPGGRIVIADMLTSEEREKADRHNDLERLCDPSHARALPESEFSRMFAAAELECVMAPKVELVNDIEEWLDYGGPSPETAREIRELMEAAVEDDRTGLRVRREDGGLRFNYTIAAFVLARPA